MMTTKVFQRVLATFLVVAAIFLANGVAQATRYSDLMAVCYKQVQECTERIKNNPNDAKAYASRASAYKELKKYGLAIQDYSKAIELNPSEAANYTYRGDVYAKLGKYKQAIQDYDKYIKLEPNSCNPEYCDRAYAYYHLGQYDKALQDFNKIIKQANDEIRKLKIKKPVGILASAAYEGRGKVYSKLGQYERAIQDYNKSIELNPFPGASDAETCYNCGLAYKALGNMVLAEAYFTKASELYYKGGLLRQEYGDMEQAQELFSKARALGYKG